jgi:Fic family protein
MTWQSDQPYNELPHLPPATELESVVLLKACIPARAALAELKLAGELLPNQGLLVNMLPLLEAKDSSEIENIVTTSDKLFQFAQSDNRADSATKEALRYRTALYEGYKALDDRPLNVGTAFTVCSTIKGIEMQIRKVPGTTIANAATGETIYTPPAGETLLRDLLGNWQAFVHAEDGIDPLIKMAVAHYQFEAIHPFTDGNGRTGRVLNMLFLIEQGLLSLPILYLSRFIVQNKNEYYRLLNAVTSHGEWQPWVLFMLGAVTATAQWTTRKIVAVRDLIEHTTAYVHQQLPKIYSHELVQVIFEQPYNRIQNLIDADVAKRQTASVYLKQLTSIGVLNEIKRGREKLYLHPKLLQLMTTDQDEFTEYT